MRMARAEHFKRPIAFGAAQGVLLMTVVHIVALLIGNPDGQYPRVVRAVPLVGFAVALLLHLVAGRRSPEREAQRP